MKLGLKERISMGTMMPKTGDVLSQSLVKDILDKVRMTTEENVAVNLRMQDGLIHWDTAKAIEVEIPFTDFELKFLKDQAKRIDEAKQVTQDNLTLVLKLR